MKVLPVIPWQFYRSNRAESAPPAQREVVAEENIMAEANPYLPRHLIPELVEALETARIVNLIGPWQVGKTTLVRDVFGAGTFITLDDTATLQALEADPVGQLESLTANLGDAPLIIDEAQRSKALALAIKSIVDANRRKGQFVLTGSSNVFTTAAVADSLAGRMRTIKLWPLTVSESEQRPVSHLLDWAVGHDVKLEQLGQPQKLSRNEYIDLVLAGGYLGTRDLALRPRQRQYRDYVDAVVDRDAADVLRIRKTDQLGRLIDQMAVRTAEELNVSELAKILAIKRNTVDQYLDVLIRLSLIIKLGAWSAGESKREIKNAKFHFVDTGVACALRRFNALTFAAGANPTALGGILESFVFNELLRAAPLQNSDFRLYHWRSADRREIDIVVDGGSNLVGIEIKSLAMVGNDDFKHLDWFAKDGPGRTRPFTGIVFYLGENKLSFGDRRFALPVSILWSDVDQKTKRTS